MNEPFVTLDWTRLAMRRPPRTWRSRLYGRIKYWAWALRCKVFAILAVEPRRGKWV